MELAEIPSAIRSLPRAEKLRLIQLVAADIAHEESLADGLAERTIPIWSPYGSFEGAAVLLRMLEEGEVKS